MWTQRSSYYSTKKQGAYDSKYEAGYAKELELRKKAKDIKDFEAHVRIPLEVNGYIVCDYFIDFKIYHNDGTVEYTETKGFATREWRIKWKLFLALYEDKEGVKITLEKQGKQYNPRMRRARV